MERTFKLIIDFDSYDNPTLIELNEALRDDGYNVIMIEEIDTTLLQKMNKEKEDHIGPY